MLYVIAKGEYYGWHVGERIRSELKVQDVTEIQADGTELAWIRSNMVNIPDCPSAGVVSWYGDHAKFIFNRLPFKA